VFQSLLIATAFDATSRAAERQALHLARLTQARCVLVHAIEPIGRDVSEPTDPEVEAFYETLRKKAQEQLASAAKPFQEAGLEVELVVEVGRRWEVIVAQAAARGVDLIVVGSGPLMVEGRPRLSTTSHQVYLAADRPVLAVRTG